VNHLVDEEEGDFRLRLRSTLEDPARDWPPIDPEGWARLVRSYMVLGRDQDAKAALADARAKLAAKEKAGTKAGD